MRTRKMVSLEESPSTPDETLLWYSRAIGIMRTKRRFTDPTSWRWQGAVHDYSTDTDPYQRPNDPPPNKSIQRRYWKQCQHSSWFFLPWHRMYLFHFERMIAAAVVEAGGPEDWTLPYWNYNASIEARTLPWAFRQPTWPGGETNYLYVPQRAEGINNGSIALASADIDQDTALKMKLFSSPASASDVQFGGPRIKWHEGGTPGGPPFGGVESSPHNHVHVAIGQDTADTFMPDPTLAALDPIFWLHHANIDRLWEVWIRKPGRANPTQKSWLQQPFRLYNARGKAVRMTPSQVVDTAALGYLYEGMSRHFPNEKLVKLAAKLNRGRRRPTLIGATHERLALGARPEKVSVGLHPATGGPLSFSGGAEPEKHEQVLLHLESIEAGDRPSSHDVYVNLPEGASEAVRDELRAGRISLFGATPKAGKDAAHHASGFSFVLDISDIYEHLKEAGDWDPEKLRLTLEPVYARDEQVSVGRVSVNVR